MMSTNIWQDEVILKEFFSKRYATPDFSIKQSRVRKVIRKIQALWAKK